MEHDSFNSYHQDQGQTDFKDTDGQNSSPFDHQQTDSVQSDPGRSVTESTSYENNSGSPSGNRQSTTGGPGDNDDFMPLDQYNTDGEKPPGNFDAEDSNSNSDQETNSQQSDNFDDDRSDHSYSGDEDEESVFWKGTDIEDLKNYKSPELHPLEKLTECSAMTIMFKVPFVPGQTPEPHPISVQEDKWNDEFVKMPFSKENSYYDRSHAKKLVWDGINRSLQTLKNQPPDPIRIKDAIMKYHTKKWDFSGLTFFLYDVLKPDIRESFLRTTLPKMIKLALDLPHICTKPIPILKQQKAHTLILSQRQIASLLANAFFCTFPNRSQHRWGGSVLADINFTRLFQGSRDAKQGIESKRAAKLHCILEYFRKVTEEKPTGTVSFTRQLIKDFPDWEQSTETFKRLHVTSKGTIEDDGEGMLQVDFANKYVGGGVLGSGCVQEEIRFIICPELIVSRLFTEVLQPNECLIMTGCQRYSRYKGYASSFYWDGEYFDVQAEIAKRDAWGRGRTEIVAIDAINFHNREDQFQMKELRRELHKAFVGFQHVPKGNRKKESPPAVATGNWGCGAFGGDVQLKALLQLIAATKAGRDLCYFTFGDKPLRDDFNDLHEFLVQKKYDVCDLWLLIVQYCKQRKYRREKLFDYVRNTPVPGTEENHDDTHGRSHDNQNSPDYRIDTP